MKFKDLFLFSTFSIISQKMRSFLTSLGIAIGVICVIFLTGLGQGLQTYIVSQFTQFGSNIISPLLQEKQKQWECRWVFLGTVKPLTFEDAKGSGAVACN